MKVLSDNRFDIHQSSMFSLSNQQSFFSKGGCYNIQGPARGLSKPEELENLNPLHAANLSNEQLLHGFGAKQHASQLSPRNFLSESPRKFLNALTPELTPFNRTFIKGLNSSNSNMKAQGF